MSQLSMHHRHQVQAMLAACPLVPVITIQHPDHAVPLGRALVAGGIRILEVTLRTEYGLGAIRQLRKALPDVWVGAGTVTQVGQYREAEAAGAQFVITPLGYQTNLMVYGPGRYQFMDYVRLGFPWSLLVGTTAIGLIPFVWGF